MGVIQTIDVYTQSEGTELLLVNKTLSDSLSPSNNWSAGAPNTNAAKTDITSVIFNITSSNSMTPAIVLETSNWFIRTNTTKVLTLDNLGLTSVTIPDGLYYIRVYPFVSLVTSLNCTNGSEVVTFSTGNHEAFLSAGYTHLLLGSDIYEVDIESTESANLNEIYLVEPFSNTTGAYGASGGYYALVEYCNSYNTELLAAKKLSSVDLNKCTPKECNNSLQIWDTWEVLEMQKKIKADTSAEVTRQLLYKQSLNKHYSGS